MCTTVLALLPLLAPGLAASDPLPGRWRAVVECPGGQIPFGLLIARTQDGWRAQLQNGDEYRRLERVEVADDRIVLHIDPYDSRLEATVSAGGRSLDGEWIRYRDAERETRLPFRARSSGAPRFSRETDTGRPEAYEGRWRVTFSKSVDPSVGLFRVKPDGRVDGTFLTTLGDYRFLEGVVAGASLRLSVFDGAHAFLFTAELQQDGSLAGDFWSRDSWHETWTAVRDEEARLPDPMGLTRWTGAVPLSELVFPDPGGRRRNLADPAFAGRARLLVLFGTWCPNCYDQTEYLVELHERYGQRGLSILGLAFEFGDDFERQARVVRRYGEHHGVRYPILIAGTSGKAAASEAFPLLDRVRAYPTTIFLDREGAVEAVYTGFSGPATGTAHDRLRERFEDLIEELLDRSQAPR